jgi:hypothetical protein
MDSVALCDELVHLTHVACKSNEIIKKPQRKGYIMPNNLESMSIEQLLAEADELIQKVNSDVIKDMKEEQRLQVEKQAQNLKKIKSEVQSQIKKKETSMFSSSFEGMHEAIQEFYKAMGEFARYLT